MTDLPVVEPPFEVDDGERPPGSRVAGVLLAAGTSSRYGEENKLLARLEGEPIVRRAGRALLDAGLEPVVVVVGHQPDRVRGAVAGLQVSLVENPDYAAGQATSVRTGVEALPDDADAAVFALGDMPWVSAGAVARLVEAFRAGAGTALAAAHEGRRGNPVLWGREHFGTLASQSGDVGGRDLLLATEGAALVETGDPGVCRDVDRPSDLG